MVARYGIARTGDRAAPLLIEPYDEVCWHGSLRPSVIASAVDIAGSLYAREVAEADAIFTIDLSVRLPVRAVPGQITTRGSVLRAGRSLVTTGVVFEADGEPFAYGETDFMRVAVDADASSRPAVPDVIEQVPLERPLIEALEIEMVDPAIGLVSLELRDDLRSTGGVMQGALVAVLGEVAAVALAEHHCGEPRVATEIDVRYLAKATRGPIVARAHALGGAGDGVARVELRDRGQDDRVTASILVRTAEALRAG